MATCGVSSLRPRGRPRWAGCTCRPRRRRRVIGGTWLFGGVLRFELGDVFEVLGAASGLLHGDEVSKAGDVEHPGSPGVDDQRCVDEVAVADRRAVRALAPSSTSTRPTGVPQRLLKPRRSSWSVAGPLEVRAPRRDSAWARRCRLSRSPRATMSTSRVGRAEPCSNAALPPTRT